MATACFGGEKYDQQNNARNIDQSICDLYSKAGLFSSLSKSVSSHTTGHLI